VAGIFAIINEKLIKGDRPMRVARSMRRQRRSHCNIMAARGQAVIGEGRSLRRAPTFIAPKFSDTLYNINIFNFIFVKQIKKIKYKNNFINKNKNKNKNWSNC